MDPALLELLRSGAGRDDEEIEAIVRLDHPDAEVPDVRIVARFGCIATCRLQRDAIARVRSAEPVASLKASRPLGEDLEVGGADQSNTEVRSDTRRTSGLPLTGAGVVVGVVDFGCDFDHPNFKHPDGSTRLEALWDQRGPRWEGAPHPYGYGIVHGRNEIDAALRTDDPYAALACHPADAARTEAGAHGTHVMDIAAGNGACGGPVGVAPEAHLCFVHLADRGTSGLANLGDSVRLLEAVHFIARLAGDRPWVVNICIGRHGGPHDGRTLVELALDSILGAAPDRCAVQSTGNYFNKSVHASGRLEPGEVRSLTVITDPDDVTPNELEVWYGGEDRLAVRLESPSGAQTPWVELGERAEVREGDRVVGRLYHRECDPNNLDNTVDLFLDPSAPPGEWRINLQTREISDGTFHAWLERDEVCPRCQTRFVEADAVSASTTGTIANGRLPLVVGAYDAHSIGREPASFSSAGPTRDHRPKPDLVAPGTQVLAAMSAPRDARRSPGELTRKSGTSMAAPQVTGAVALCLQGSPRPLRSEEIRALVLECVEPAGSNGSVASRYGRGYLDLERLTHAVSALRERHQDAEGVDMNANGTHCERARTGADARDEPQRRLIELLKRPITAHEQGKIEERVRELTSLFGSLNPGERDAMRGRLDDPEDQLGRFVECELDRAFRTRLRKMLDPPVTAPALPVAPATADGAACSCRRDMHFVTTLCPWEKAMLALANGTREEAFDGMTLIMGPLFFPGIHTSIHRIVVGTALEHGYAITMGNTVWFPKPLDTSTVAGLKLLVHESVHLLDYERAGTEAIFIASYVKKAVAAGFTHDEIPDEKRANRVEDAVERLLARFPQLTAVIASCNNDAILAELRRGGDQYRAALNELLADAPPTEVEAAAGGSRVVFIPGTLGSMLVDSSLSEKEARQLCARNLGPILNLLEGSPLYPCNKHPERVWDGIGSLHWLFEPEDEWRPRMTSGDGHSKAGTIRPHELFEAEVRFRGKLYAFRPYKTLVEALETAGADVLVYPYDWRMSCYFNAAKLQQAILAKWFGGQYLEPGRRLGDEERIIFIGHSLGGLVARYFLESEQLGWALARRLITIGTPHRGAPQAYLHLAGITFPFPENPFYRAVRDIVNAHLAVLGARARLPVEIVPRKTQLALVRFMASAFELLPIYDFVVDRGQKEPFAATYSDLVHMGTARPAKALVDDLRRNLVPEPQLDTWLGEHDLDYHFLAGTGFTTAASYERAPRKRVVTTSRGDGTVPLRSATVVRESTARLHTRTFPKLSEKDYGHQRLCERADVQAYCLSLLPSRQPAPTIAGKSKALTSDYVAMAKWILRRQKRSRGVVLSVTRLAAYDGSELVKTEIESSPGSKHGKLKNPPKHLSSWDVQAVELRGYESFRYVWMQSNGQTGVPGGMLFLPAPGEREITAVTLNTLRLDDDFRRSCDNDHHAEMQLVRWITEQPRSERAKIGTIRVSNRSRRGPDRGPSPCNSCCVDLAEFLKSLNALVAPRRIDASISWEMLYTGRKDCGHPTDNLNIRRLRDAGWGEPQGPRVEESVLVGV